MSSPPPHLAFYFLSPSLSASHARVYQARHLQLQITNCNLIPRTGAASGQAESIRSAPSRERVRFIIKSRQFGDKLLALLCAYTFKPVYFVRTLEWQEFIWNKPFGQLEFARLTPSRLFRFNNFVPVIEYSYATMTIFLGDKVDTGLSIFCREYNDSNYDATH